MATYSFTSPTLTITFTAQELALLSRIQTENPGAIKGIFDSYLAGQASAFLQKDIANIKTFLATASPTVVTQICNALGIAQA